MSSEAEVVKEGDGAHLVAQTAESGPHCGLQERRCRGFSTGMMRLDLVFSDPFQPQSGLSAGTGRHHPGAIGVVPQVQGTEAEVRQADLRAAWEADRVRLGIQLDWS